MAKKREDRSSAGESQPFDNPFAKLQGLKASLPEGEAPKEAAPEASTESTPSRGPLSGRVIVRKERAGRGGKTVTIVEGVALGDEALEAFAREMKKALGCGASVEETRIVLQGELEERARDYLEKRGAKQVILGTRRA